jgi:hypothetical protein
MTNPIRVTIHQSGSGVCSLSGKEGEGLTVSFEDGTVNQQHLSWKSFRQLVAMKTAQHTPKPAPKSTPAAVAPSAWPVATSNPK